jgi:hypothetical protein
MANSAPVPGGSLFLVKLRQGLGGVPLVGLLGAAPTMEWPAGHELVINSDQMGPAASQPLQQLHPPSTSVH